LASIVVPAALSWRRSSLCSLIFLLPQDGDCKPARGEWLSDFAPVHSSKLHLHDLWDGLGAKRLGEIGMRADQPPLNAVQDGTHDQRVINHHHQLAHAPVLLLSSWS